MTMTIIALEYHSSEQICGFPFTQEQYEEEDKSRFVYIIKMSGGQYLDNGINRIPIGDTEFLDYEFGKKDLKIKINDIVIRCIELGSTQFGYGFTYSITKNGEGVFYYYKPINLNSNYLLNIVKEFTDGINEIITKYN